MKRRDFLKTLTKAVAVTIVVPLVVVQATQGKSYYERHVEKCVQEYLRKYPLAPDECFEFDWKNTSSVIRGKIIKIYPNGSISKFTKSLNEIYKSK